MKTQCLNREIKQQCTIVLSISFYNWTRSKRIVIVITEQKNGWTILVKIDTFSKNKRERERGLKSLGLGGGVEQELRKVVVLGFTFRANVL